MHKLWLKSLDKNSSLFRELLLMKKSERIRVFSESLSFGTSGIRAKIGVGPSRLNIYTIRKISCGLGHFLIDRYKTDIYKGIVISHDNRYNSRLFALETANVLSTMGIKTYLFSSLRPTPVLSYTIRYKKALGGVMITASHNPKEYNGFKVYDSDGCQYLDADCMTIKEYIDRIENPFEVQTSSMESLESLGLVTTIDDSINELFVDEVSKVLLHNEINKNIKIVYTPLSGTGSTIAPLAFSKNGFDAHFVEKQMKADPSFKNVDSPNPENESAFKEAIKLAKEIDADLIIATDPDADRIGIGVKDNDEYKLLSGNETGALITYYLLSEKKKISKNSVMFNTIVTGCLADLIAESYGVKVIKTLTGFKYIASGIKSLEGTNSKFLLGFEESYGYLLTDSIRDKDSMSSLLLISEMANYYLNIEHKTLIDKLEDIEKKYGYFVNHNDNIAFESADGKEKMENIVNRFRTKDIPYMNGYTIIKKEDYLESISYNYLTQKKEILSLPKSNVIKFVLDNGFICIRPSGTEPKLKVYYSIKSSTKEDANIIFNKLKEYVDNVLKEE